MRSAFSMGLSVSSTLCSDPDVMFLKCRSRVSRNLTLSRASRVNLVRSPSWVYSSATQQAGRHQAKCVWLLGVDIQGSSSTTNCEVLSSPTLNDDIRL